MSKPVTIKLTQVNNKSRLEDWGVLPIMAYTGRLRPKGVLFLWLQVYQRVGILLVEVYERVAKSVIWVCKRARKEKQMNFIALKESSFVINPSLKVLK